MRALRGSAAQHPITVLPQSNVHLNSAWGGVAIPKELRALFQSRGRQIKTITSAPLFLSIVPTHLAQGRSPSSLRGAKQDWSSPCDVTIYGWDYGSYWVYDYSTVRCWNYALPSYTVPDTGTGGGGAARLPAGLEVACGNADDSAGKESKLVLTASNNENREHAGFLYRDNVTNQLVATPAKSFPFNPDG